MTSGPRPRIAVYAIARDEATRVESWAASAADADVRLIADTGSSDDTVERAAALGVDVHRVAVEPFRYDVARNRALDLLPDDVDLCVPLDMDEELAPGWRQLLDEAWAQGATRISYSLVWPWSAVYPDLRYTADKIHARHGCRWRFPVHERSWRTALRWSSGPRSSSATSGALTNRARTTSPSCAWPWRSIRTTDGWRTWWPTRPAGRA